MNQFGGIFVGYFFHFLKAVRYIIEVYGKYFPKKIFFREFDLHSSI